MVSSQLLKLENSIQNLSLKDKLWLLEKLLEQLREIATDTSLQEKQNLAEIEYDPTARPIWEIAVEIGRKIPESEWEKVPSDLSKNFDFYQSSEGGVSN